MSAALPRGRSVRVRQQRCNRFLGVVKLVQIDAGDQRRAHLRESLQRGDAEVVRDCRVSAVPVSVEDLLNVGTLVGQGDLHAETYRLPAAERYLGGAA